jgi:hypothetical protein
LLTQIARILKVRVLGVYDFVSYNDESFGTPPQPSPWFAIAGYVAAADTWAVFEEKWSEVLQAENLVEFKASDCENRRGDYEDWTPARRAALQRRLIHLIMGGNLTGVWTAIDIDAYKVLEATLPQSNHPALRRYHDPYFFAFSHLLQVNVELIVTMQLLERIGEQVAFVFDKSDWTGRAAQMYADHQKLDSPSVKYLGGISFDDSKKHPALQAADLLAYEARRFAMNRSDPRWQWLLLKHTDKPTARVCLFGDWWDADEIAGQFAKWQREGLL